MRISIGIRIFLQLVDK